MLHLKSYVIILGLMALLIPVTSEVSGCFSEFCFTIPDSNQNFDDAKRWCTSNYNSSTLAAVTDPSIQKALTAALSNLSSYQLGLMYIDARLKQNSVSTWYLLNGTNFLGGINDQNINEYRYYVYLKVEIDNVFIAYASNPLVTKNYICEYSEDLFSSVFSNSVFCNNGRCYVKYENESLTWYKAREKCKNSGGDLMMFIVKTDRYEISSSFNTSWLNPSLSYWVGIRWKNWAWISPDNGPEIVDTNWSSGKPNNSNFECVCVDPNGNPKWSWADCDCNIQRQFLCFKIVPTTTTSTASSSTLNPGTVVNAPIGSNHAINDNDNVKALIVGLVLGIAVILPLLIINLILVIVIVRQKNQLRNEQRKNSNSSNRGEEMKINNRSEIETENPSAPYEHLDKRTQSENTAQHYDHLHQNSANPSEE